MSRFIVSALVVLSLGWPVAASAYNLDAAVGKYTYDVASSALFRPVMSRIRREVGPTLWPDVKSWLVDGVATPIKAHEGIYYVFSCKQHDCHENQIGLAIPRDSRAVWMVIRHAGLRFVYGNPPQAVREYLIQQAG